MATFKSTIRKSPLRRPSSTKTLPLAAEDARRQNGNMGLSQRDNYCVRKGENTARCGEVPIPFWDPAPLSHPQSGYKVRHSQGFVLRCATAKLWRSSCFLVIIP